MKNRKFWALLIALVMMFTIIAACGDADDPAPPPTDDVTTNGDAATDPPPTIDVPDGEPYELTVTWFHQEHFLRPFIETEVGAEIQRRTGVTIEFISGDPDLFMVLAAAGDLPDVLFLANDNGTVAQTLLDGGQVLPLDDLLEERGQNILRRNRRGMELLRDSLAGAEHKYFIPVWTTELNLEEPNQTPWTGIYARHDLWVEMGAPEINGEEEFLLMLRDMQDAFPVSPVGTRTYAISGWTDWGMWPYFFMYSPHYNWRGSAPFYWNIETYEMRVSFVDPDSIFWAAIDFYFRAAQLEILDPEGLVQNWAQYSAKINNGEIFTAPAMTWEVPFPELNGEEALMAFIPGSWPAIHDVWADDNPGGWGFANCRAISTNARYPGRVMDVMNFLDSDEGARLLWSGIEGLHWDWVDGEPQPIGENLQGMLGDTEARMNVSTRDGVALVNDINSGTWTADDGFPVAVGGATITRMIANENPAFRAFAEFHGMPGAYPGEVYAQWVRDGLVTSPVQFVRVPDYMPAGDPETGQAISLAEEFINSNLGNLLFARDRDSFEAEKARIIHELYYNMGMREAAADMIARWEIAMDLAFASAGLPRPR